MTAVLRVSEGFGYVVPSPKSKNSHSAESGTNELGIFTREASKTGTAKFRGPLADPQRVGQSTDIILCFYLFA
jgi:hypothetical protein